MKKSFSIVKFVKVFACVMIFMSLAVVGYGCKNKNILKKASKELSNYKIEATLCDDEKKLTGTEVVDYINTSNDKLEYLCFNLYGTAFSSDAQILPYTTLNENKCFPNGVSYGDMVVESVRVNGQNAKFEITGLDNNALMVYLGFELQSEELVEVEIQFVLQLANTTHRLGYFNNEINLGNWYPIVAVYENGSFDITPYYSTGDPFYSECANYEVTINFSESMSSSYTGNLVERVVSGGVVCEKYQAFAVRDFALCLSSDFALSEEYCGETLVRVFSNKNDTKMDFYKEVSIKAVNLFNRIYGVYPYEKLDVVFTNFLHGGMEYPNIVYIANNIEDEKSLIKVIVHEIAHQWWYGVVGNNEIKNAWIDESMAEYSTLLFFENFAEYEISRAQMIGDAMQDYLLYIDVAESVKLPINKSMQLSLDEYSNEYEYVYMVYVKGLVFIDELRKALGDDIFFKGVKNLYKNNMFKVVDKEIFIEEFKNVSDLDIEHFVESWLSGTTNIE